MGNLRLSKEHGVNPTLSICIICKEPTGEIALLGDSFKGEAPMHMITNVVPCETCKKKHLKNGTLILSATCRCKSHSSAYCGTSKRNN